MRETRYGKGAEPTAIFQPRKTIPASEIGVSLRISDETIREIERLEERNIASIIAEKDRVWR